MVIKESVLLAPYTTLKIGGPVKFFCEPESAEEVREAVKFAKTRHLEIFVLGGGSNIVIADEGFRGLAIHPQFKGIEVMNSSNLRSIEELDTNPQTVFLKLAAGENWDKVVKYTVDENLWGIENLSHIPGNCGAIAVQNIGAYGQEISQVVESVEAFEIETGHLVNFSNADCQFGYRQSIFNSSQKGTYIILSTTIRLSKQPRPNLSYRDLQHRFDGKKPSLADIRQAVIEIRNTKFPFPTEAKNGNVGSFFKNPILTTTEYQKVLEKIDSEFGSAIVDQLQKKFFTESGKMKIPAAFLIDICSLKNASSGGAGINPNQPLVILNKTGSATATDIINLAKTIQQTVFQKTGIKLKAEPEFLGLNPADLK